jgi:uncharacterized protein YndB with AHSA1/START domain
MSHVTSEPALRKSVLVGSSVGHAFRVFTEGIGGWWPVESHSVFAEDAETAILEGRVGGRLYERSRDGEEAVWGTVTAWEPPHRIALTWHPGRGEETAQELEVRFTAAGGGTRVELVHSGWERLGERAGEVRARYETGWEPVLGSYVEAAGSAV